MKIDTGKMANSIVINGKFLLVKVTGAQRVAHEIANRLPGMLAENGVPCKVLTPPAWIAKSKYRSIWATLWEQFVLPVKARRSLLVNLCNSAPVVGGRGQAVIIYDAAVFDAPENYSWSFASWNRFMARRLARSAIFSASEFSRRQLSKAIKVRPESIALVEMGCDHIRNVGADVRIVERLGLSDKKFILAIGSIQPGKNFGRLIKAMDAVDDDVPLVVVGGIDPGVFGASSELTSRRVIRAGYVSDEELVALFQRAAVFVQPSVYEGFGLPALEAMALGVPIACSKAASLPEVCGDAAVYFEPYDVKSIADAINRLLRDDTLQRQSIEKGVARATNFSWDHSTRQFASALVSLAATESR